MIVLKLKLNKSSVQELADDNVIMGISTPDKRFLTSLSYNFEEEWRFPITRFWVHYCKTDADLIIFFDGEESLFIDKLNGQLIKSETNIYLFYNKEIKVMLDLGNQEVIKLFCGSSAYEIKHENAVRFLFGHYFISLPYSNDAIKCHNVCNETNSWELKYKDLFSADRYANYRNVVNYKDSIFFWLKGDNDYNRTIGLDITTGQILYNSDEFAGFLTIDNHKIYSITDQQVNILDPETFKIETIDLQALLKQENIALSWDTYKIRNGYLFYTDFFKPTFGVIDLKQKTILWQETLEVNNEYLNKIQGIQLEGDSIFINTSDDACHLFKISAEAVFYES